MRYPRKSLSLSILLLCALLLLELPVRATETRAQAGSLSIPILMYHHVAQAESYNTMTVSPQRFEADMTFLRDFGFTALLPADLEAIAAGEMAMPARPVMITFDDGYESNYTHMFPILQKTGMKATVNLITMLVRTEDTGASWALSWEQCQEMYQSGLVDFGSHTWNLHNPDSGNGLVTAGTNGIQRLEGESFLLYKARVGIDLTRSVATIQENVGNTVRFFAYPFGLTDPWAKTLLKENGITLAVTTGPGLADLSGDLLSLPRYRVDMSAPLANMQAIVSLLKGEAPPAGDQALAGDAPGGIPEALRPAITFSRWASGYLRQLEQWLATQ